MLLQLAIDYGQLLFSGYNSFLRYAGRKSYRRWRKGETGIVCVAYA
jgi:hypothetical protein